MSLLLRKLLARFLRLGVDDGEGDPAGQPDDAGTPPDNGAAPPDPDDTPSIDDVFDTDDTPSRSEPEDPKEALRLERARRETLERELANRPPVASMQQGRDPDYEREEQQIAQARRDGANDDQIRWLQWQIDSNRKIRQADQRSQAALAESRDIADRTAFEQLQVTKPKTYRQYKDRVESAVNDMRAKGQAVPPRMAILRFMLGDDIMNGKLKPKARAGTSPAAANPPASVPRNRLPNVRSDVSARGNGTSERDKRRARLDGVPI